MDWKMILRVDERQLEKKWSEFILSFFLRETCGIVFILALCAIIYYPQLPITATEYNCERPIQNILYFIMVFSAIRISAGIGDKFRYDEKHKIKGTQENDK